MEGYDLEIATPAEWGKLTKEGLDIIVDPLIYRIGQIYLEGPQPHFCERQLPILRRVSCLV